MLLPFDTVLALEAGEFWDIYLGYQRAKWKAGKDLRSPARKDGEGARGQRGWKAPAEALSTVTCQTPPESHLFFVTLNKMLATPVGPMWG